MENQPKDDKDKRPPIFGNPEMSIDETEYLDDPSEPEPDPIDNVVSEDENMDPKLNDPIGAYGNIRNLVNIDSPAPSPADIDDVEVSEDDSALLPLLPDRGAFE